jgi:succinate-semialdehyde dehydrogenase/glutarate-semialdehyde dehydrogenase
MKLVKHLLCHSSLINGSLYHNNNDLFSVLNPSNGSVVHQIEDHGANEVILAIDSAHQAFDKWKQKTAAERSYYLFQWHTLILENKETIAHIMALESGKVITECRGEIDYGAAYIKWYAEEARRNYGTIIPGYTSNRRIQVIQQPTGVVSAITPWNFPLAMITRKIAPALAVGCTVVVRPSELTPLTALAINYLAQQAGFPNGVINTVVGTNAGEMGKILCTHPKVAKLSFTGSTRVGKILTEQSAENLTKLSLELGGNAPFIVFNDADINLAIQGVLAAKFRFSGQTCVCVNRILVQDSIHDQFIAQLQQAMEQFTIKNPLDENANFAPMIHHQALERMKTITEDAVEKGGTVIMGGKACNDYYFEPTLITNCNATMLLAHEEIFGPIAAVFTFKNENEAITMANDTIYGLASYCYTNDLNRSIRVSEALEYGIVGINEGLISSEVAPFGGIKQSGHGREGSKFGLEDYTFKKYICTGNVS